MIKAAIDKQFPPMTAEQRAAHEENRDKEKPPVFQMIALFSVLITLTLYSWLMGHI